MSQNQTNYDQDINFENQTQPKKKEPIPIPKGAARAVPLLLIALSIFLSLCFITQGTGTMGKFISSFLLGLFSYAGYILPLLVAVHGIFYYSDLHYKRRLTRFIFSAITIIGISSLIYVIRYWGQELPFTFEKYYTDGTKGAGLIGSMIAYALIKIIGPVGVVILTVVILALYMIYFFGKGYSAFSVIGLKILTWITTFFSFIEKRILRIKKNSKKRKEKKKTKALRELGNELSDDDYFAVDNGMQELAIPELGIHEVKSRRSIEENPTLHERVRHQNAQKANAERSFRAAEEAAGAQAAAEESILDSLLRDNKKHENAIYDTPFEETARRPKEPPQDTYMADDSAEAVFTKDFDPFNITLNTALASKKSSRATEVETEGFKTEEDALPSTPEEMEERMRKIEFEKKKQRLMEERQRRMEAFEAAKAAAATAEADKASKEEEVLRDSVVTERPTITYAPEDAPETPVRTIPVEEAPRKSIEFREQNPDSFHSNAPRVEEEISARREKPMQPPQQTEQSAPAYAPGYQNPYNPAQNQGYQNPYQPMNPPAGQPTPTYQNPYAPNPAYQNPNPYTVNPYPPAYAPQYGQSPYTPTQNPYQNPYPPAYPQNGQAYYPPTPSTAPTGGEFSTVQDGQRAPSAQPEGFKPFSPVEAEPVSRSTPAEAPLRMERETIYAVAQTIPEDEQVDEEPQPIPPEEQNPRVLEYRNHFAFLRDEADGSSDEKDEAEKAIPDAPTEEDEEEEAPPFDNATDVSAIFNSYRQREIPPVPTAVAKELRPDYSDYKLPPLDLLAKGSEEVDEGILAEIQERQEKLIDALASFNVTASIKGVDRGPRVTRYEVVPAKGTKSNAITNLFDDICMALAAKGVRMESIPERSAIGFEIPNKKPQTVRLRDLIESEEFLSKTSKTSVCIGKDVTGNPVFGDIAKMPHVLVAGATGMGKSVCINAILISMLYKARPDEVKLILVDPKKVEFNVYNGIPHLLIPVVTDPKQAAGALMWAVEQMEKRYDMIEKLCVRNIEAYNEKVKENPSLGQPMPKIVIVIDELNDLMIQVRDPVENLIMSIAQKARAAGIHLIIGTQRPSVNVITGVIKANIPSRISCKVSASVDSRTILERAGAEKLLNNGDMLFHPVGLSDPIRVQGAFVTDSEVESVMEFLKKQTKGNSYDEQAIEDINRAAKKCSKKKESDFDGDDDNESYGEGYLNDQKFLDAVDVAIKSQKIATSLIQRKLSIGYGKAAKYIDVMESLGIVGAANGSKPREVKITMDEWHEMLARRDLD